MNKSRLFILFDTNIVSLFKKNNEKMLKIGYKQTFFNETHICNEMLKKIDNIISNLNGYVDEVTNQTIRLYAVGIFQELSQGEKQQLKTYVFVKFGLYFNIITPELEIFYSTQTNDNNKDVKIINGIAHQEFRKIVVCGSFQKNISEINSIIDIMNKHNIEVLSPWTKEIVVETIGTDFILLQGQELLNERDSWRHKLDHMNKFIKADAIVVCNPQGMIGQGTMFEFGFMVAYDKRIIFTNKPKGISIMFPYEIGLNFD